MQRFIFFTKTLWSEPPRLRHQLAHLLASSGYPVIFGERPWKPFRPGGTEKGAPKGIEFFRHAELLHHWLRFPWLVRSIDAAYTRRSILRVTGPFGIGPRDVIVNFSYDAYFLRDLFPQNRMVTVINDDFITRAPSIVGRGMAEAQRRTCRASDAVLTVSEVLQERLSDCCEPQLFLPWAEGGYQTPSPGVSRDTLFYWGFIGRRIDFALCERLATDLIKRDPGIRLVFIGPIEGDAASQRLFHAYPNVSLVGPAAVSELPADRAFGSIVPYVRGNPEVDAIALPNKALQLLARGLPLLISGMPRFQSAPFVYRLDEGDAVNAVTLMRDQFDAVQPAIRTFVEANGPEGRLRSFLDIVARIRRPSG